MVLLGDAVVDGIILGKGVTSTRLMASAPVTSCVAGAHAWQIEVGAP